MAPGPEPAGVPASVPQLRLPETPPQAVLDRLCQLLRHHGYTEDGLADLYGHPIHQRRSGMFPAYFFRTERETRPLGLLARLFLQHRPQRREEVAELISEEAVAALVEAGLLLQGKKGGVRSATDLYPVEDQFIFTDACFRGFTEKVYHLGTDSYSLTRLAPHGQPRRALDLCTGSGVQAVVNRHAHALHLVDINPRAVAFANWNLMLNGLWQKAHVHLGSLWEAIPRGEGGANLTFDWITANPPFVPDPGGLLAFQGGGGSGEEITQAILEQAEARLEVGGILAMVTNAPERPGESQLDKLRGWLGGGSPWGIIHLVSARTPADEYITHYIGREDYYWSLGAEAGERQFQQEFLRWIRHYHQHQITHLLSVIYIITRLPAGAREWSVDRSIVDWNRSNSAPMKRYADTLYRAHGPEWHQHDAYRLSEEASTARPGFLFLVSPLWGVARGEDGDAAALADFLEVKRTGQEILEWGRQRSLGPEGTQLALCRLAQWGALDLP